MPVLHLKLDPSQRELRWFGVLLVLFFGLTAVFARWKFNLPLVSDVLCLTGFILVVGYFSISSSRIYIYRGWVHLSYPIGWVVSHIVLAGVYYLVITPIGILASLFRHDVLERGFQPELGTYWKKRSQDRKSEQYFRQF